MRSETVRLETGVAALDALTGGGLPLGAVTELVGVEGSGRTTLAMQFAARRAQEGQVCAWIDASDALDPEMAAGAGIDLERLLWVRCGALSEGTEPLARTRTENVSSGQAISVSIDRSLSVPSTSGGCGSPHPRSEARGMSEAISTLLGSGNSSGNEASARKGHAFIPLQRQDRSVGTPGAPNRPVTDQAAGFPRRSADRVEQVASDRLPSRRAANSSAPRAPEARWDPRSAYPRCAEPQPGKRAIPGIQAKATYSPAPVSTQTAPAALADAGLPATVAVKGLGHTWKGLDRALRAADLVLQGGGFGVVVLDLGSLPPDVVWRVPLATWFRFRAAAERTRASLLLLTQHACARSSAELVLEMEAGAFTAQGRVMTGMAYEARIGRQRFAPGQSEAVDHFEISTRLEKVVAMRKPPQPERAGAWHGQATWAGRSGAGPTGSGGKKSGSGGGKRR